MRQPTRTLPTVATIRGVVVGVLLAAAAAVSAVAGATHAGFTTTTTTDGSTITAFTEGVPVTDGLVLELRADDLTLADGEPVSLWPDTSGQGNDATQPDTGRQPTYAATGMNGQPTLLFDGASDYLDVADDPTLQLPDEFTIFAVVNLDATTSGTDDIQTVLSKEASFSNRNYWLVQWDGDWAGRVSPNTPTVDGLAASTDPEVLSYRADGQLTLTTTGATAAGDSYGTIDTQAAPLRIGEQADDGDRHFTGAISAILLYDRALDDTERDDVTGHLADRWL